MPDPLPPMPAAAQTEARNPRVLIAAWTAFACLLIWNYLPTLKWMIARWDEAESYMAHGWLIPPISLWLLWQERDKLRAAPRATAVSGFFIMLGALLLNAVAGLADVSSISGLTLVAVVFGFTLLQSGPKTARIAWFPILFLVFMVPPPEFIISKMNFSLKLMAADMATGLLNLVGLPAIRQGSFMVFGSEKLAVGDVCSGLRSLLALLSLSVLYAWMVREKGKRHVLAILVMAIPAAIIGNGIRIFLVSCLVMALGQATVFKPLIGSWDLHLFTGAIIFIAAFTCLYVVSLLLEKLPSGAPRAPAKAVRP
jgi:exosortase